MKTTKLLALLALLACTTGEDAVTDAPSNAHSVGGVEFSAETLIMESFPVQLRTIVTARNTGDAEVELNFPTPCVTHLRVYDDSTRSGEPLWVQERFIGCVQMIFDDSIAAGDTAQYAAPRTDGYEILGDSLPDGRYWLSATLRPNGQALELPAGVVDLAIPRD